MPETIELPPEDIRDFVAIQHDADGKIRVKVVEAKKHITSVQRYLTLLRSRYPGKISKFDFTTLDVIATLNSNNTERAPGVLSDGGINTVQRKVLDYIRKSRSTGCLRSAYHTEDATTRTSPMWKPGFTANWKCSISSGKKKVSNYWGATYSGMTDVIKGTQFDPGVPQDARLSEQYLKLARSVWCTLLPLSLRGRPLCCAPSDQG